MARPPLPLGSHGKIKVWQEGSVFIARTKFRDLCVEGMVLRTLAEEPDPETGELPLRELTVLPTHFKCPQSGAALPVENPEVWVYQDDGNAAQEPA